MSSRSRRAASRANGRKSRGPVTPEGKAKSRFNALKHGIDAKQQVMFTETPEDLAELAAEYHELHKPANPVERFLVDTLVDNEWRLRRMRRVEADLWRTAADLCLDNQGGQPETGSPSSGGAFSTSAPAFERLQRLINSCERNFHRAMKALQAAQADSQNTLQAEEAETTCASSGSFRNTPDAQPASAPATPVPGASPTFRPGAESVRQFAERMAALADATP
jgi:hypothetical protein